MVEDRTLQECLQILNSKARKLPSRGKDKRRLKLLDLKLLLECCIENREANLEEIVERILG